DAMPTEIPGDRGRYGRAGYADAAGEQRVPERPVVAHVDVAHAVLGLALGDIDVDGVIRRGKRPEESVGGDAGVVVDDLMRVRVEGVNYPPIDVESDEREGSLVVSPVGTAKRALHEAHVRIEEKRFGRCAVDLPGSGAVHDGRSNVAAKVGDGRRLHRRIDAVDVQPAEEWIR